MSHIQCLDKTLLTMFIALTGLDPPGALQHALFPKFWRSGHCSIGHLMYYSQYSHKLEIKQSKSMNLSTLSMELHSKLSISLQRAVSLLQN